MAMQNIGVRTLSIAATNPTTSNVIILPDTSGTVITTGNLIDINGTVTSINVTNNFIVYGSSK